MEKAAGERGEHVSYPHLAIVRHSSAESSRLKTQGVRLVKVHKRKVTLNGEP